MADHDALPEMPEPTSFAEGARAMFDWFHGRAANHWHGNPEQDKFCQMENRFLLECAEEALEDVSPETAVKWKTLNQVAADARKSGYQAGREAGLEEAAKVAESCGRPVGASDGSTYVPGTSSQAASAIRSLKGTTT